MKGFVLTILTLCMLHLSLGLHAQVYIVDTVYIIDKKEQKAPVSGWQSMIVKKTSLNSDNTGTLAYYDTAGTLYMLVASNNLKDRVFDGECLRYRNDGTLISKKHYVNDTLDGMFYLYFDNQQVAEESQYHMGELLSSKYYTRNGEYSDTNLMEHGAIAPEGWASIIRANLKYPDSAKINNIEGRVMVSFIVEKDGSITHVEAMNDPGGGLAEEAVRVVNLLPSFAPAIREGRLIRYPYRVPITFSLEKPEKAEKKIKEQR